MEKFLRPTRFTIEPNTPGCDKHWVHWKKTFDNFMGATQAPSVHTGRSPLLRR